MICLASHKVGDAEEQEEISLADCNLEPIDLIYIIAKDLEGGNNNAEASELESRIAFAYRNKRTWVMTYLSNFNLREPLIRETRYSWVHFLPSLKN